MTADASRAKESRALRSGGTSHHVIYDLVARVLQRRIARPGVLVELGCGSGELASFVRESVSRYIGVDLVKYGSYPSGQDLILSDLDGSRVPLADGVADIVAAVETVEHLENPRAFVREMVRLVRPGGLIVVTTPNQLSLLSLLNLIVRHRFVAFGEREYPAHLTALLELDLRRIASENGLVDVVIEYSRAGRVAGTSRHYPSWLVAMSPRRFSDNVLLLARKPDAERAPG